MNESDYQKYLAYAIQEYATDKFKSGFMTMEVGIIWYGTVEKAPGALFLFDFEIWTQYRRNGYGRSSLELLEKKAREEGWKQLELHVFGHNSAAIALYQQAGFEITDINMRKGLG